MRDASINLRVEPGQRDLINHAARILGKNRSDFMLEAACERAKAVILDQVYFQLSDQQYQSFVALLDAPEEFNQGLNQLMAVTPPWTKKPKQ